LKGGTTDVQGVSFGKGELHLKGSQIDRSLSYGNITRRLGLNRQQGIQAGITMNSTPSNTATMNTLASDNRASQEAGSNLFQWTNNAS
jgi:hypothetical protein